MNRLGLYGLVASSVTLGAACSAHNEADEATSGASSALTAPGLQAEPKGWNGSAVDLMVADAWAGCAFSNANHKVDEILDNTFQDTYLGQIRGRMSMALCNAVSDPAVARHWYKQRTQQPSCNVDPSTKLDAVVAITPAHTMGLLATIQDYYTADYNTLEADAVIRTPQLNLCIAQRLRQAAPGSAGAEALLLTGTEQRELLERTRERLSMALLDYAGLNNLLTSAPLPDSNVNGKYLSRVRTSGTSLGQDLIAAVQLYTVVSQELAELYARGASAKLPRGAVGSSMAEDEWGPGAWRTRALSVLYGGSPDSFKGQDEQYRFVRTSSDEPQVQTLLQLARRFDALDLKRTELGIAGGCSQVEAPASAQLLLKAVEAGVRTSLCTETAGSPATCRKFTAADITTTDPTSYELWKRYRIEPHHAEKLVLQLSEMIGRACQGIENGPLSERAGAMNVFGNHALMAKDGALFYHIDKEARFMPLELSQYEGLYGAGGPHYLGSSLFLDGFAQDQGYSRTERARTPTTGSVQTLVAVREMLETSRQRGSVSYIQPWLYSKLLNTITAAVGDTSVAVLPAMAMNGAGNVSQTVDADSRRYWRVVVRNPGEDAFWNVATSGEYTVFAVPAPDSALAASLALDPSSNGFRGTTLASLLATAPGVTQGAVVTPPSSTAGLKQNLSRFEFALPTQFSLNYDYGALIVRRTTPGLPPQYRLLGDQVRFGYDAGSRLPTAQYLGFGGALNVFAQKLMATDRANRAVPQYDAFGLPVRWVPPTDPALFSGSDGIGAEAQYLDNAQRASEEATAAVKSAFDGLLDENKSEAELAAAVEKGRGVDKLEQRGLCGDNVAHCEPVINTVPLLDDKRRHLVDGIEAVCKLGGESSPSIKAMKSLACTAFAMLKPLKGSVPMPAPVSAHANDAIQPSFAEFGGGELRSVYIEQWSALRQIQLSVEDVNNALEAAKARVDAALVASEVMEQKAKEACSANTMNAAVVAGTSVTGGFAVASISFNMGPWLAAQARCKELGNDVAPVQFQAVASLMEAIQNLASHATRFADGTHAYSLAAARGAELIQKAKLAAARQELETAAFAQSQVTSFGLYRRYHAYDMWRAKALLESARRYALTARRAIEARYVVDLSKLNKAEPFVAEPSTWADEVYEYDLNMPSAVGLTVAPQVTQGGIYPNRVLDYVGNLRRFVSGYSVARPTAFAKKDSEVISLPSPEGWRRSTIPTTGQLVGDTWSFYCPTRAAWRGLPTSGRAVDACEGERPTKAQLAFSLDPWGRVSGDFANPPFTNRYNARWGRYAVNLVGTGVLECANAADPLTCYSEPFVRYSLTHNGPAWVSDADGAWVSFAIPRGRVEGAKALAAEHWLDPLTGWSKPFVESTARGEWTDRAFGGAYLLELQLGPEVHLERVERVQVLTEDSYFVKQN